MVLQGAYRKNQDKDKGEEMMREMHGWELTATEADTALGFAPTGLGTRRVVVNRVNDSGWAVEQNIEPGDRILQVNGKDIKTMEKGEIVLAFKSRPVTVVFLVPEHERKRRRAKTQEGVAAAEAAAATPVVEEKPEDSIFTLQAGDEHPKLGFVPRGFPPDEVFIKSTAPGWAEDVGVLVGDQVLKVNHIPVEDMDKAAFIAAMKSRPLIVEFRRSPPGKDDFW